MELIDYNCKAFSFLGFGLKMLLTAINSNQFIMINLMEIERLF